MLVNKKKNEKTKNKQKKSNDDYEENLQSMRSWVRKIEQTTNSVSSRLSAVEKRLSVRKNISDGNSKLDVTITQRPITKVLSDLNKNRKESSNELIEVSNVLDNEFERIQDDIADQQAELDKIKEKITDIDKSIVEMKDEIKKTRVVESKSFFDLKNRLETMEKRAAPIMKLGKLEVPIEISGIIAGVIAIFAALFIILDQTSILISPIFLGAVGIVFIGSAVYKAARARR